MEIDGDYAGVQLKTIKHDKCFFSEYRTANRWFVSEELKEFVMKKYIVIYLVSLIGILAIASSAAAKDHLWIAKQAAKEHASQRDSYEREISRDVSTEDRLKGQRLWIARQQAREQVESTGADSYGLAGRPDMTAPDSVQETDGTRLMCEKNVPGFTPFQVRHYGDASKDNRYCG
jgi:hypothetical protein